MRLEGGKGRDAGGRAVGARASPHPTQCPQDPRDPARLQHTRTSTQGDPPRPGASVLDGSAQGSGSVEGKTRPVVGGLRFRR